MSEGKKTVLDCWRRGKHLPPCAPKLFHVLPSRRIGWNKLCNPVIIKAEIKASIIIAKYCYCQDNNSQGTNIIMQHHHYHHHRHHNRKYHHDHHRRQYQLLHRIGCHPPTFCFRTSSPEEVIFVSFLIITQTLGSRTSLLNSLYLVAGFFSVMRAYLPLDW